MILRRRSPIISRNYFDMMTQALKNWQKCKLGDLAQDVRQLYTPTKDEELPYVGLEHIEQQTLHLSGIGQSNETESTKKIFKSGDVLFGTLRPYFRKVTMPKFNGVCSTDIAVIRPTKNSDGNFLKYFIANQDFIDHASNISSGTRMPRANWKVLKDQVWLFPKLTEQKEIGDVLVAYDDLIENNTSRIEVLEQMAQAIYQEAFASTSGKSVPLGEAIKIHRGKSYGSHELSETDGIPFVNLKCVDRDGGFRKSGLKRFTGKYKDTHKVVAGDIVMAVTDMTQDRRIVARAARVPTLEGGFGVISMDLVKIEPKEGNDKDYIYSLLRWSDFANEVKNHANGANVLHLIPDRITDYKTYIAPIDQQKEFGKKVGSLLGLIDKLELQNESLRQSRDLLLPKLVTGEIRV